MADSALIPHEADAPAQSNAMTPMDMLQMAVEGGADVQVIEQLMTLYERWQANQGRKAFDRALSDAKAEIGPIVKSREVDFTSPKGRTHYKFEDLASIARAIDPILSKYGLSYRFRTHQDGPRISVTCIIAHRDGHYEENTLAADEDHSGNKNPMQAIGSAVTYLQRYTLKAALGLSVANDDDGQAVNAPTLLTMDQADEIDALIREVGADRQKFLKYMRVESIADIPQSKLPDARAALNKKREKAREDA